MIKRRDWNVRNEELEMKMRKKSSKRDNSIERE